MSKDYYKILGVNKNSSEQEIKSAYRKLALTHHPDRGGNEDEFKEISEAYDILSNPEKKSQYDQFGHVGKQNMHHGFGGQDFNFDDILKNFGFGQQQNTNREQVRRGADLRIKIKSNLFDILKGCTKKIKFDREISCNSCVGTGAENGTSFNSCFSCGGSGVRQVVQHTAFGVIRSARTCVVCNGQGKSIKNKCVNCKGEGVNIKNEIFDIEIPRGAVHGTHLKIEHAGNAPRGGKGIYGDLIVLIEELKDENLIRDGINIMSDVYISIIDAILGNNSFEVSSIEGKVKIKIDAGTENGRVLRLKGKGIPSMNGGYVGDQLVYINVYIPKNLNEEEKKKIKDLESIESIKPNENNTKHSKGVYSKIIEYQNLHN